MLVSIDVTFFVSLVRLASASELAQSTSELGHRQVLLVTSLQVSCNL